MKRNILLSMTVLSAVVVTGSTPLTTYAAEAETVRSLSDKCYKVYVGQGMESLSETLKQLGITLGNNGNLCPDIEIPDMEIPGVEKPGVDNSDVEKPETQIPEETQKPENTQKPEENQKPDIDVSDEATLSYAEQVVKLVNEERAKAGLPALKMDADITAAANVRAKEIVQKFSHTRPNGSNFSTVLKEQGVSFRGSGENIAWGQKSPEQVMNAWMNSEGHRANILNKNYKNIGVGYYQNEKGVNYWVQLFTY